MIKKHSKQPAVIGLYGYSNSGKTTLIEKLICQLRQEKYKVAAIKVSGQEVSMDQPGKDTWRYAHAGAGTVVMASREETDFMIQQALDTEAIIGIITEVQPVDIILIEGVRDAKIQKIRLGDKELRENTIWDYDGIYEHLLEKIHSKLKKGVSHV